MCTSNRIGRQREISTQENVDKSISERQFMQREQVIMAKNVMAEVRRIVISASDGGKL